MRTYNYSNYKNKDFETLKNDYLFIIKRSVHQNAFDKYTDKCSSEFISIIENIPSKLFTVKFNSMSRRRIDDKIGVCFDFTIKCSCDHEWIYLYTHESYVATIGAIEKEILIIYNKLYDQGINYSSEAAGELDLWAKRINEYRADFANVRNYLNENKSKLAMLFLTMKTGSMCDRMKAQNNRVDNIYEMENLLNSLINKELPEVGEKVIPSWNDYNCYFHYKDEREHKSKRDEYYIFVSKEGEYFILRTPEGKKKRLKNVCRYLPWVRGFEDLEALPYDVSTKED